MTAATQSGIPEKLFDRYLSTHFGAIHSVSASNLESDRRTWRGYFARFLPASRTARILDLGCGYGSFLHFLRSEGYCNASGVDASREQVEAARAFGIENVFQGDGEDFLNGRQGEFDCITAFDLLEHLPKQKALALLEKTRIALAPEGVLILRVPNADGPFGGKILYSDFTHELAFTPSSIRQVLALAEFRRVEVFPEGPCIHGALSAMRWIVWRAICAALLLYLAAETGRLRGHILTQNLIAVARKPREGELP